MQKKPLGKIITIREFMRSFVELMKYETMLNALYGMIDNCVQEREILIA